MWRHHPQPAWGTAGDTAAEREEYDAQRNIYLDFVRSQGIRFDSPAGFGQFVMRSSQSAAGQRAMRAYRRQRELARDRVQFPTVEPLEQRRQTRHDRRQPLHRIDEQVDAEVNAIERSAWLAIPCVSLILKAALELLPSRIRARSGRKRVQKFQSRRGRRAGASRNDQKNFYVITFDEFVRGDFDPLPGLDSGVQV